MSFAWKAVSVKKFERQVVENRRRKRDRQFARADAPDAVCLCGWITALPICPNCDLVRPVDQK